MTGDWPTWATERIEIVDSDPEWPRLASELAKVLDHRLAPWLDGCTEHVGSTSVPGLVAKPVVDLMAPVRSLDTVAHADRLLSECGWYFVPPHLDHRPWRRFYVLPQNGRRVAHLQLVEPSHPRWRDVLGFRDRLLQRPDLAAEYAKVKREAASVHAESREAYTAAKSAFIRSVVTDGTPGICQASGR